MPSRLVFAVAGIHTLRTSTIGADQSARAAQAVLVIGRPLGLFSCWPTASTSAEGAGTLDQSLRPVVCLKSGTGQLIGISNIGGNHVVKWYLYLDVPSDCFCRYPLRPNASSFEQPIVRSYPRWKGSSGRRRYQAVERQKLPDPRRYVADRRQPLSHAD
jgi:hypothetical protein